MYKAILQFELPCGQVDTEILGVFSSVGRAREACQENADKWHGVSVSLRHSKAHSTATEVCYDVLVKGRLDTTEWYVIREEA